MALDVVITWCNQQPGLDLGLVRLKRRYRFAPELPLLTNLGLRIERGNHIAHHQRYCRLGLRGMLDNRISNIGWLQTAGAHITKHYKSPWLRRRRGRWHGRDCWGGRGGCCAGWDRYRRIQNHDGGWQWWGGCICERARTTCRHQATEQ